MRKISVVLALGLLSVAPRPAAAQAAGGAPAREDEPRLAPVERSAPQQHFEQALVHYRAGRYRAAIGELEAALVLDPNGKDLLYNLALVHEKLGELDRSIAALERYVALEADPNEIQRAEQAIARMRGARAELAPPAPPPAAAPPPLTPAEPRPSRVDGLLIATSSVAVAAAVVGIVFGVRALTLRPVADPRTDSETSIADLHRDRRRAKDAALVADIGFAVSLLAGGTTAVLWLGRAPCEPAAVARELGISWAGVF